MTTITLSHKELTTLNFCLMAAEILAQTQDQNTLTEKIRPLRSKIMATIDNNYNDREVDEDEIDKIYKEIILDDNLGDKKQ